MKIFGRISRAIARLNKSLGSDEGTTAGTADGVNPALRHIEGAERQEFPPEQFAADEDQESE